MFHHRVVAHHRFDDLHGVVDADGVARLADYGVALGLYDFGAWVGGRGDGRLRLVDKLLVFLDDVLLADSLEAVAGAFQQVGQHLLDGFVGTRIAFDAYLAQLGLAESHIQFIVGEEFFQGFVQGARLDRERNQRVERLGLRALG